MRPMLCPYLPPRLVLRTDKFSALPSGAWSRRRWRYRTRVLRRSLGRATLRDVPPGEIDPAGDADGHLPFGHAGEATRMGGVVAYECTAGTGHRDRRKSTP